LSEDFPAGLAGFRAGSLLAGYQLLAQVGAGGMAVVFRARDERLGRLVALKILAPALASDPEFRRRFIGESGAAAVVDDPHIIPVYEAGEADGVLFIAMRFVGSGDLQGVLDREGPLALDRAAEFVSQVASVLDAAHRAGLVHRDVKPGNIMVDTSADRPDHVYLSDFGISKRVKAPAGVTGTGQYLGTPVYSAPEQIRGLTVDGRTDQYALACVAYQLLTGRCRSTGTMCWRCCLRSCPSRRRRPPRGGRACRARRMRCWPGRWPRSRRSGTGAARSSPARCVQRSAGHPTIPQLRQRTGWPAACRHLASRDPRTGRRPG
jgi:serine/threonine protein kinase